MLDERLRRAAALVFVEDLAAPRCSDEDAHHLRDVLRLRVGEQVAVGDGAGRWRLCVVAAIGARRERAVSSLVLEPAGEVAGSPGEPAASAVAFCLPKGDRGEWAVQKLTELGVGEILPVLSERTVVRLDADDRVQRGERLRRVAREAAGQARRTVLPRVTDPAPFGAVLADLSSRFRVALAEPGGRALGDEQALVVGPEGGWAPAELAAAPALVDLGPSVLRAETAAVVAGVVLALPQLIGARGGEASSVLGRPT